jgi:hypothetical protein
VYTETVGVGHAFVSIGSGQNTTVFTYGRYAGLDKDKSVARSTTPTGEGVLVKLEGQDAIDYIADEFEKYDAQAFEITDADGDQVLSHLNEQHESSNKVPTVGKYAGDDRAKVVDTYSLPSNNCTTKACEGVAEGGSEYRAYNKVPDTYNPGMSRNSQIISPAGLQSDLNSKSKSRDSNVKNVTNSVKQEYDINN